MIQFKHKIYKCLWCKTTNSPIRA